MLKRAPGAADPKNLKAADAQAYVATNCVGEPIPLHLVAADGLTMASVNTVAPDAAERAGRHRQYRHRWKWQ